MRRHKKAQIVRPAMACLLLLGLLLPLPEARAEEPMLAIRLADGESAFYMMDDIVRINLEGVELAVVLTNGNSDYYDIGSIAQIECLWQYTGVEDPGSAEALIDAIHLFQNQPNPFAVETRIGFELQQAGTVTLQIYGLDGRLARTLDAGVRASGSHTVHWNGLDDAGRAVSSGVYFYKLTAPGIEESRRMILLP